MFEDETDLLLFPPLRSAWAHRGKPNRVWLSGGNAKKVIFGTINLKTGHHVEMERPRQRSEDFCAFLKELHRRYRGRRLLILLDSDPSHTAKKSQKMAAKLDIHLLWLPIRSPELNPMETLWGFAKHKVCANRQYETIRQEARKFKKFLRRMSRQQALISQGYDLKTSGSSNKTKIFFADPLSRFTSAWPDPSEVISRETILPQRIT